jgi:hypothetical protein
VLVLVVLFARAGLLGMLRAAAARLAPFALRARR